MRPPASVATLTAFGRTRLSPSFFMRDFLYSEIAAVHGLPNLPADPDLAIATGTRLCTDLLEPLQASFGRLAIRSAYRAAAVNDLGNARMRAGKAAYNCATTAASAAGHIWDRPDATGRIGATACVVVPGFWDRFHGPGDWRRLAWWIHDHLPYCRLQFFPRYWACNITWSDRPQRRIDSFVPPRGCLTKPGMPNHAGRHDSAWAGIAPA